ncbi:right-handed parallel beta-helix repeat-containing protein [Flavisolibacter sp. BT320]|nr:right-handed parallel beta-helix repeat-containing protein [Flavisolibacter longurius]
MKILFISLLAVLVFGYAQSQTYYLDPVNGDNAYTPAQAQNPSTPWKNFAAVNTHSLTVSAGARFRLKGGQYGPDMLSYNEIPMTLAINSERGWVGTDKNPIIIEAQPGQMPVFTTYKTASNPIPVAGKPNVFAYVVDVFEELSIVEIDGHVRSCGRYPKRTETEHRGYLMGREKSGGGYNQTATIEASFIPSYDLVGGDVVIRNSDYIVSVHPITAQTFNSIDFFNVAEPGIEEGFGTYFQNHLNILSENYEWAHKRGTTDTLYVYFADGNPANHTVRYASSNFVSWVLKGKSIQFKGITFEGANIHAVKIQEVQKISFESCHFRGAGRKAIWQVNGAESTVIRNSTARHCLAGGFDLAREANCIVENNKLDSISVFNTRPTRNAEINAGKLVNIFAEGMCGDAAIIAEGNNSKINNNTIFYAGFNGINWNGASTTVNGNFINYTQLRGKDGGGIYSYNIGLPSYTKTQVRTISNNTILNVVGDPGGTADNTYSPVFGIYNDDETNQVKIINNTIANATRAGIYNHHTQYIAATGNRIFNCEYGYYTRYGDNQSTKLPVENTFSGDLVVSNASGQIQNSFTVVQQGVFSSITPAQTASMRGVNYFAFDEKQERVLIYNPAAESASISYNGGPYRNILTGAAIGASPLPMAAYSSIIGYKAKTQTNRTSAITNNSFTEFQNPISSLTLAPNPVNNTLSIKSNGNTDPLTVTLFDITGRKLIASAKFTTNYQLDFSNHQKGTYIILLTNSKSNFQERRVIIKN